MLRALMISDVYFPRVNGVSTSIATFRSELATLGLEVPLAAPAYGLGEADEPDLLRLRARRVPFDPEDRLIATAAVRALWPRLAERRLDLVHVQTPFVAHREGVRLARAFGVPVVATYHTHFEQYFEHYLPWLPKRPLRALARAIARRQAAAVDRWIVPSTAMRETLERYGVRCRIEVLPTGVRLEEFAHGDGRRFRARHGIAPERPLLLHVGRLGHEKNVLFLLEVLAALWRRLPDALLLFAGEGPARRDLEERARELHLSRNVQFLGYLDRAGDLADCYRAGDLFLFASKTETQGLVLLEAMASSLPVVALAEMGTRDLLATGRGARVVEEKPAHFVAAILDLLGDRRERQRLAGEARTVASDWTAREMGKRLAELYGDLAASHALDRTAAALSRVRRPFSAAL